MKTTGIVRKIDELGRIVLPVELRRSLGIEVRDPVEIFVEGDAVMLRKYRESCVFCGAEEELTPFEGKFICPACLARLQKK